MAGELTKKERTRFKRLDALVRDGLSKFLEVGRALREIHDDELYREHGTFEEYMHKCHGLSRIHGHRLICSATLVDEHLLPIGNILPTTETQCRELLRVPEEKRQQAWRTVLSHAENTEQPITAEVIRDQVAKFRVQRAEDGFDPDKAATKLRDWLRSELDKWPDDKRSEAAHWIRQIVEKEFGL